MVAVKKVHRPKRPKASPGKVITEYLRQYKANVGCLYCREKNPDNLEFHHRNSSEKLGEVRVMFKKSTRQGHEELRKCDVVCVACHDSLHGEVLRIHKGMPVHSQVSV